MVWSKEHCLQPRRGACKDPSNPTLFFGGAHGLHNSFGFKIRVTCDALCTCCLIFNCSRSLIGNLSPAEPHHILGAPPNVNVQGTRTSEYIWQGPDRTSECEGGVNLTSKVSHAPTRNCYGKTAGAWGHVPTRCASSAGQEECNDPPCTDE